MSKWQNYVNEIEYKYSKEHAQTKLDKWTESDYKEAEQLFSYFKNKIEFIEFIRSNEQEDIDKIIIDLIFSDKTEKHPSISYYSFLYGLFKQAKETCSHYSSPPIEWFSESLQTKIKNMLTIEEVNEFNQRLKKVRNNIVEDILRNIVFMLDDFGDELPGSFALIEMNNEGEVTDEERLIQGLHDSYEDMLCVKVENLDV